MFFGVLGILNMVNAKIPTKVSEYVCVCYNSSRGVVYRNSPLVKKKVR